MAKSPAKRPAKRPAQTARERKSSQAAGTRAPKGGRSRSVELPEGLRTFAAIQIAIGGLNLLGFLFIAVFLIDGFPFVSRATLTELDLLRLSPFICSGLLGFFQLRWALRLERLMPDAYPQGLALGVAFSVLGLFGNPLMIALGVGTIAYLIRPETRALFGR